MKLRGMPFYKDTWFCLSNPFVFFLYNPVYSVRWCEMKDKIQNLSLLTVVEEEKIPSNSNVMFLNL